MAEKKEYWRSLASLLATQTFCQTLLQVAFKPELWFASLGLLKRALSCYSSYCYFDVAEMDGDNTNDLYSAVQLYLSSFASASCSRLSLSRPRNSSATTFEDIDCSANLSNRSKAPQAPAPRSFSDPGASDAASGGKDGNNSTITLSGLLNFTDGLWSCCGSERIFVFTTNHIDKLDPALLRSGRMDMHIHMGYCSYPALKILLRNYLDGEAEDLGEVAAASELGEAVEKAKMTPADISEVLIKNRRNKEKAVGELLEELKARAERNENYGGLREEYELNGVEEEEEEKRTLESPKEESDCDDDSCKTGG